ncbi:MAG TPA: hypothetical protein VMF53_16535 [Alphaproteobacteria bacterium]|nr:hypothetical protein [Alphaproteobacteria bacterium]
MLDAFPRLSDATRAFARAPAWRSAGSVAFPVSRFETIVPSTVTPAAAASPDRRPIAQSE